MKKFAFIAFVVGIILLFNSVGISITGQVAGFSEGFSLKGLIGASLIFISLVLATHKRGLEAIIVPTGPNEKADRDRAYKGAWRFHKNPERYVIVSGQWDGNYEGSKAQRIYEDLLAEGVPKDHIIFEKNSGNTWENVAYNSDLINERGFEKVIIATDKPHAKRFKMLFKRAKREGLVPKNLRVRTDSRGIEESYDPFMAKAAYLKDRYLPIKKKD